MIHSPSGLLSDPNLNAAVMQAISDALSEGRTSLTLRLTLPNRLNGDPQTNINLSLATDLAQGATVDDVPAPANAPDAAYAGTTQIVLTPAASAAGVVFDIYDANGGLIQQGVSTLDMRDLVAGTYHLRVYRPNGGTDSRSFTISVMAPPAGQTQGNYEDPARASIHAGSGSDFIEASSSLDSLYGGSGADTFVADRVTVPAPSGAITNASYASGSPITITSTTVTGLANGNLVEIVGVEGNTNANGVWQVENLATNLASNPPTMTFQLLNPSTYTLVTGDAAFVSNPGTEWYQVVNGVTSTTLAGPEVHDFAPGDTYINAPLAPTSVSKQLDPAITIPDPGLRMALAQALGIPVTMGWNNQPILARPITGSELASLTSLNASNFGIGSYNLSQDINPNTSEPYDALWGLQCCINLVSLDLADNDISDLTPLTIATSTDTIDAGAPHGPRNLEYLSLDNNQITDLSPLDLMTNLRVLSIDYNPISSLAPLSSLGLLSDLSVDDNTGAIKISDLSPLQTLVNLQALSLAGQDITNLEPLTGLSSLQYIDVANNDIQSADPLLGQTVVDTSDTVLRGAITAVSGGNGNPVVITSAGYNLSSGQQVLIAGVSGVDSSALWTIRRNRCLYLPDRRCQQRRFSGQQCSMDFLLVD